MVSTKNVFAIVHHFMQCLLLNYKFTLGAAAVTNSYTERVWYVHINDLNCTGSEESLWDCPMNGIRGYSCNHNDDSAVMCQCKQ